MNAPRSSAGIPRWTRPHRWMTAEPAAQTPGDALVVGDRIAAVGPRPRGPRRARREIDAVRRHRDAGDDRHAPAHVADRDARLRRRLDADPVLRLVLPRARQARSVPRTSTPATASAACEALDAGRDHQRGLVARPADHRPRRRRGRRAQAVPGRFVLAYGNIQQAPWEWTTDPAFRDFVNRRITVATTCSASRSPSTSPATRPSRRRRRSRWRASSACRSPRTPGVWGATNDDGIRLMHEQRLHDARQTIYVHAATLSTDSYQRIAATGGSVSVSTEASRAPGRGYPPTWQLRKHDIPVSLSMDTSVWWSGDLFSRDALDARRRPARASTTRRTRRARPSPTITLRAQHVVDWATRGGAKALGPDELIGSLEAGQEGRRGAHQERRVAGDRSRSSTRTATWPSRRSAATCHTVVVNGRIVKRDNRLVDANLPAAKAARRPHHRVSGQPDGLRAWAGGMNPDIPEKRMLENPYMYTEWKDKPDA